MGPWKSEQINLDLMFWFGDDEQIKTIISVCVFFICIIEILRNQYAYIKNDCYSESYRDHGYRQYNSGRFRFYPFTWQNSHSYQMKNFHITEHSVWSNIWITSFRTVGYRFLSNRFLIFDLIVADSQQHRVDFATMYTLYNDIQNSQQVGK